MPDCVIDTALFWQLPGPRRLASRISLEAEQTRALIVNLPIVPVPGTMEAIRAGLRSARIESIVDLVIRDGMDVASEVGEHISRPRITGAQLAGYQAHSRVAVVLGAEGPEARRLCEDYAVEFIKAAGKTSGNVHLITAVHDADLIDGAGDSQVHLICFDGGLSTDEMDAYVALRMVNRVGPGSTRLLRAIVSEFAGFDVQFAERLLLLADEQLVGIVGYLGHLLDEDPERWRRPSWLHRTTSSVSESMHVLHDCYLARHGNSPERREASERISRRYWLACLKTITPWLEERRRKVLAFFQPQIDQLAALGQLGAPKKDGGYWELDPDDVEYNNIVGMAYGRKLFASTLDEKQALRICHLAKNVRDDIAHLRAPSPEKVTLLVNEMDQLIQVH